MAEPISLAAGLLALAIFAFKSSIALHNTIHSIETHPSRIRELNTELEALSGVLDSLTKTVSTATDVDLTALTLPLLRCGNACKDFEQEILKCSTRSGGNRTSFRDWAKLRYMGDDVDGFRRMLSGYKSTITIALADANLRMSTVTAESIEKYQVLIKDATGDLEAHLQEINEKFDTMIKNSSTESTPDSNDLRLLKEERMSATQCLQICAQLSEHISKLQLKSEPMNADALPERVTFDGLQECKITLALTTVRLEGYMKDIMDRMVTKSRTAMTTEEDSVDLERLRDEWETTRQCKDICAKADTHLMENVSNIENYATGDAIQYMVSTDGKTLHGKNRGLGPKTDQVGGHLSDLSLQILSQNIANVRTHSPKKEDLARRGESSPSTDNALETEPNSEFGERYGRGVKLISSKTGL